MNITKVNNVVDLSDNKDIKKNELQVCSQNLPFPMHVLVISLGSPKKTELATFLSKIINLNCEYSDHVVEHMEYFDLVLLIASNDMTATKKTIARTSHCAIQTILLGDNINNDIIRTAMQSHVRDIIAFTELEQELFNSLNSCASEVLSKRKVAPVISIINGKAGSGASFITGCLGEIIANLCSDDIVLIDADLNYGCLADSLKLEASYFLCDALAEIDHLDGTAVKSMMTRKNNLSLLSSKPFAQLETELNKNFHHLDALLWKIKLNHDLVMVDLSRGLETLTLPAITLSKHILIVVQQNIVSLREAKALIEQLTNTMEITTDNIKIIINRYSKKMAKIDIADIKRVLGVTTVFCVSNNYQLANACTELGSPLAKLSENKVIQKEIYDIIAHVYPIEQAPKLSFFKRIFKGA